MNLVVPGFLENHCINNPAPADQRFASGDTEVYDSQDQLYHVLLLASELCVFQCVWEVNAGGEQSFIPTEVSSRG